MRGKIITFLILFLSLSGFSQSNQDVDENTIFTLVEEMPQFPGGEKEKIKFIQKNINFPEAALKNKTFGKCFLKFAVMKDGSIGEIIVMRGVPNCPDCDAEAKRVISIMPKWIPGKQNGNLVNVYAVMPFNFSR